MTWWGYAAAMFSMMAVMVLTMVWVYWWIPKANERDFPE